MNGGVYFHSANLGTLYIQKIISDANYSKLLVQLFLCEELLCRLIGKEERCIWGENPERSFC